VKLFKWVIGAQRVEIPSIPGMQASNCIAVVLAEDEAQARALLTEDPDLDLRWLEAARLVTYDLDRSRLVAISY
jgi:hypothetical protein